ncbi:hypothetical protein [Mycoplasma sp. 1654_15]|uniref:hypothetical protein n=1 Tax=Mycoplasma sp. 1654_15 TaxID=2725994 RepID=UPI001448C8D5|nr:hypothetical protein [Mycoplasma sp. 1654_15]QJB71016.1 hypothetical protein HF996_00585 [Mycoplasma sp. 1654_15]
MSTAHLIIIMILPFILFLMIIFVFSFEKHYSKLTAKILKPFSLEDYLYLKYENQIDFKKFFLLRIISYITVISFYIVISIFMILIFNKNLTRFQEFQEDTSSIVVTSISAIILVILMSIHLFLSSKMFIKNRQIALEMKKKHNISQIIDKLFKDENNIVELQNFDFEIDNQLFSKLKTILEKSKIKSLKLLNNKQQTHESIFFKSCFIFSQYFFTFVDKNFKDNLIYYYKNKKIDSTTFNKLILNWIYTNIYEKYR